MQVQSLGPMLDRSPGKGNSPLQCSCLRNAMDRGTQWATIHGVTKELATTEQLNNNNHLGKGSESSSFSTVCRLAGCIVLLFQHCLVCVAQSQVQCGERVLISFNHILIISLPLIQEKNEHVQFSSVAQSCLNLCDPMNCSTPGLPVHHQLPEFLRLMAIESVMPSSHLILCRPLLLQTLIPPSIRVFSNESTGSIPGLGRYWVT